MPFTNILVDEQISLVQVKAKGTMMQLVGADWLRSDTREDDLSSRPGSIVQVQFFPLCLLLVYSFC